MTRWPTPDELLPVYEWVQALTPLPEVIELPPERARLEWNLAVIDSQMGELQ
jgi:hypothetical protein